MSTNVAFFETTLFSLLSTVMSPGEDDDLLVYYVSLLVPTLALFLIKPLITQVYSRLQNPQVSCPTPTTSSSNQVQSDDLSVALHKGKCQCAHPMSVTILWCFLF